MISLLTGGALTVWGWLSPLFWRHGIKIGIAAAVFAAYLANNAHHRAKGRDQVVQASKKSGAERNEKVREIRRRVPTSGAWERLRREYSGRR